ncbi:dUTPase [Persephonella hydrogeniphila]|uniref:dUTPase n=1 Tax=Persephonella hydrogeniphila TaxID=198703 RepID=A0A285N354_9AQUI|nr:dUTP diphosphatase [Persephonella hydrogeniphila]SNZ02181.1 dUTPase [Persephonella hydrogeniphila]
MVEKILEMFQLQEELNRKINENWRDIRTYEDFARATWIECAELVDSLPWKWWKKQEADMENVQIEVVDIWHFIMSYILLGYKDAGEAVESEEIKQFLKGLKEDFTEINIKGEYINHYLGETDRYRKIIFLAERVAEGFLKQNAEEGVFFFGLLVKNTISFDNLYLLYIGKNVLNHIRQEKGYNSGEYRKIIDGKEDNQYLFELVREVKSRDELERKIREAFEKIHN